ncbi:esterase/lipase family protein [Allocoleopsis franciscana]|uniref:Lipase (Class 2) n=1 Tax=Allocoleopsis franciscana PCC 7113 TaxID=1173027 RepID=K9WKJ3_9CYAN|nr:alpha/beta fold hydrolase [Allocoleopsis franciscana]AFZ20294.1 Lipase (class 2) [Allocoleopsis franciscana PCC 7113]
MNNQNNRNPVVLVHGIIRTSSVFRTLAPYLIQQGWSVYLIDLKPNNATLPLEEMAAQVRDFINKTFPPEQPIDLVGLSMGGLVTRYYVQRLGGMNRVQRFITISAPNQGTWLAYFWHSHACVQMRPGSVFLEDLNQDVQILEHINFTSLWTAWDFIIIPARNSQMPVGRDVKLSIFAHAFMVVHPRSLAAVVAALSEPIKCEHVKHDRQPLPTPAPQKSLHDGGKT